MSDESTSEKSDGSEQKGDGGDAAHKTEVAVISKTPENAEGKLNPSAPGETGTTDKAKG